MMMSLKPRNVDFQETWANLKQTVEGVVALRSVARAEWNTRFSDVYALCVAHPEPLADRLYDETRNFLEQHVCGLLERVRGEAALDSVDPDDGLLDRYVSSWHEYSEGVRYLNCLYSYLNLQHVKRQKISDAEIIYGSAGSVSGPDQDSRQLEVGELGLTIWERVLIRPLSRALTARIVRALSRARDCTPSTQQAHVLRTAIHSMRDVCSFKARNPLSLYETVVLQPFLQAASQQHASAAAARLERGNSSYMRETLDALHAEMQLCTRFLHPTSSEAVRNCFEQSAIAPHLPALHSHCSRLLKECSDDNPDSEERRLDLHRLYLLVRSLSLQPLVASAHEHVAREGRAALAHCADPALQHAHFVQATLDLHDKYSALFKRVFLGAAPFMSALDKACADAVNGRDQAPDLLARYCDSLLRKRGGGGAACETEVDQKLNAAILVFKYVDDKDVFQKHYARALARRLIHQLSTSMDAEEAMINRLKAACGYEFTNKLHRMFTDITVSQDLNTKFQQYLRDENITLQTGFSVSVLQAGAWPLGAPPAPLPPPARLAHAAQHFDTWYSRAFSGRRLAWLHALSSADLRYCAGKRLYHLSVTTHQCAILLSFETEDRVNAKELRESLQMSNEVWPRHVRPLIDAGLLTAEGEVEEEECTGTLVLNTSFQSRRAKIRLTAAPAPITNNGGSNSSSGSGSRTGTSPLHCDDERKLWLQACVVRVMKQRRVLRHADLVREVTQQARASFAPNTAMLKKCIEALIDKQYLERTPDAIDTYCYLA